MPVQRLQKHLALSARLQRVSNGRGLATVTANLETWQKRRLQASYADFAAQKRYRSATAFFSNELYAPPHLSRRDRDIGVMAPFMRRLLPSSAMAVIADAVEMQVMTLCLDLRLAATLRRRGIDVIRMTDLEYACAYRDSASRAEREDQIGRLLCVGAVLESLVHRPVIYSALRMARWPAQLSGLGQLQRFLEKGFSAFRAMHGAREFLQAIRDRELAIIERLFSGSADPFANR